jgi:hypothetical protein
MFYLFLHLFQVYFISIETRASYTPQEFTGNRIALLSLFEAWFYGDWI